MDVNGVKLTDQQVAWLGKVIGTRPAWGIDDKWDVLQQIARAVYDAMPADK